MSKDDLMSKLADAARIDDQVLPELEALSSGQASKDEIRALEERARQDPAFARQLEAFRPLEEATLRRLDAIAARGTRPRWRRWAGAGGAVVLAAAGALLALRPPPDLPPYALEVTAGEAGVRGASAPDPGPRRLRADANLSVVLRPVVSIEGTVVGRAFVLVEDRDVPRELEPEVVANAVRLHGVASALAGIQEGNATFVLMVGRAGAAPETPELVRRAKAGEPRFGGTGWHAVRVGVQIYPIEEPH